jgi:hypothetical protein
MCDKLALRPAFALCRAPPASGLAPINAPCGRRVVERPRQPPSSSGKVASACRDRRASTPTMRLSALALGDQNLRIERYFLSLSRNRGSHALRRDEGVCSVYNQSGSRGRAKKKFIGIWRNSLKNLN